MGIKKCRTRQEGTVTPSSRSTTTTEGNGKQSDSEELQQFSRHVESEVARWQHEINQTEQHWIKKLQSNKSENDNSAVITSTRANGDSPAMNGNSRKWEVESSRSEGSTVSSDSEFSPRLPSVKELSKHFSGGTDSDSSTSASKGPSPSPRLKGTDLCTAMKEVVIITKEDQLKDHQQQHYHLATPPTRPVRQVHSLTARSMTREFREGLRRNFPVAMDRNVYNTTGSDSSLTGAKSPVNGRDGYDTTPGYTSDESGTVSPVPTPGQMRNNIAFWEQMNNSKYGFKLFCMLTPIIPQEVVNENRVDAEILDAFFLEQSMHFLTDH
uniref:Uncharacterized protein n=1 Tax=Timema genevievae TaxID=629358 RepID=A0A7R9PNF9_TIMGE|nr:unnamed protein product [Timema genevievae]